MIEQFDLLVSEPVDVPSEFRPSRQQEAIYDWCARCEDGHLVVRARAGTGKTTTIIEGIGRAPELYICVAAFNKRIQEELNKRLTNRHAEARTYHSIGCQYVRRNWKGVQIAKGNKRAIALADAVCGEQIPPVIKRLVAELITKGRELAPHATCPEDLTDLALEYDCEPDERWSNAGFDLDYVEERAFDGMLLAAEREPVEIGIDYADMLYLPLRNGWLRPTFDLMVVDEAQDMNASQLEMAQAICGGRIAIVGDDRQAIYGWRGADSGSIDRLKGELAADELGLTVTYRCGRSIVDAARQLVPDFEAADSVGAGEIRRVDTVGECVTEAGPGDFILSRTNAPLAKVAMTLLRAQKRVRVQGKSVDDAARLKGLVQKLMPVDGPQTIETFLSRLVEWEAREVTRAYRMDREERVEGIRDKAETLRVLSENLNSRQELDTRLENLFSDKSDAGAVICSSIHRSKGFESKRVFVLRPTLYPSRFRKKGKPVDPAIEAARQLEESNLEYVAITRAIDTLVWVDDK